MSDFGHTIGDARKRQQDPLCICKHHKSEHIYEEGACRPGYECSDRCTEYQPVRTDGYCCDRCRNEERE